MNPGLRGDFKQSQMLAAVILLAGSLLALLLRAPGLSGQSQVGLFLATAVILTHWIYGVTYALSRIGAPGDLTGFLADTLMLLCVAALPLFLDRPWVWYGLGGAAFSLAWLKYRGLLRLSGFDADLRAYMRRKGRLDLGAALGHGLALVGALLGAPGAAWLPWTFLAGNLAAVFLMAKVLDFYRVS